MSAQEQQNYRNVGFFLAGAGILFLIGLVWHAVVHPFAGATAEQASLIQERASIGL